MKLFLVEDELHMSEAVEDVLVKNHYKSLKSFVENSCSVGLAIAKAIIGQLGGEITAQSAECQCALFTFEIPG